MNCREAEDGTPEKVLDVARASLDSTAAVGYGDDSDVVEIVNNVGVARHETIDAVELGVFTAVMDFECPPSHATHASSAAGHAGRTIRPHHQCDQSRDS